MSCAIQGDFLIDCLDNVGGNKTVYLASFNDINSVDESSGLVTDIVMKPGKRFYKIQVPQGVAEGKDTPTVNQANGASYFEHELSFPINKRDASARNFVLSLVRGRVVAVTEELNGEYKMYGKEFGLYADQGSSGTSGVAAGDRNGYNLVLKGLSFTPVLQVQADLVEDDALLNPG